MIVLTYNLRSFLSRVFICGILSVLTLSVSAESRKDFIRKYKHIAVREMERTGIPASIKLAQGILESGCGKSELSVCANNHFGIKCHDWVGPSFHMDDDTTDECFRKYEDPEDSWVDHSEFLLSRPRYATLFELRTTDYKAWAKGLKAAGYATNPKYADMLIKIIEEEHLYQYDHQVKHPAAGQEVLASARKAGAVNQSTATALTVNYRKREEMKNGLICLEIKEGDSFENIARYYNIKLKKLLAYNDKTDTSLEIGQYVYLKKKKSKAAKGYEFHRVKKGDTLYLISQTYGVRLKNLVKYNYISSDTPLVEGEKIYLRSSAGF